MHFWLGMISTLYWPLTTLPHLRNFRIVVIGILTTILGFKCRFWLAFWPNLEIILHFVDRIRWGRYMVGKNKFEAKEECFGGRSLGNVCGWHEKYPKSCWPSSLGTFKYIFPITFICDLWPKLIFTIFSQHFTHISPALAPVGHIKINVDGAFDRKSNSIALSTVYLCFLGLVQNRSSWLQY